MADAGFPVHIFCSDVIPYNGKAFEINSRERDFLKSETQAAIVLYEGVFGIFIFV